MGTQSEEDLLENGARAMAPPLSLGRSGNHSSVKSGETSFGARDECDLARREGARHAGREPGGGQGDEAGDRIRTRVGNLNLHRIGWPRTTETWPGEAASVKSREVVTVKSCPLMAIPPGVVIVIRPVVSPCGTVVTSEVVVTLVMTAFELWNLIVVEPGPLPLRWVPEGSTTT
jgi:hypothetical protein